jgi:hypothetical protein
MAQDTGQQADSSPSEFLGIPVTPEGKARARRQLAEAAEKRTPEALAQMRAKIGLPPVAAA